MKVAIEKEQSGLTLADTELISDCCENNTETVNDTEDGKVEIAVAATTTQPAAESTL